MNVSRLIFGIIIFILALLFLIYTFRKSKKDKNYDAMSYSFDINIVVGTGLILLASIFLICRELLKLKFVLIILTFSPFICFGQSVDCNSLKDGVFEVYENHEKVGRIYRNENYQLEDYFDGKKLKIAKIREKNCSFYMKSYDVKEDLDTITWAVTYKKIRANYYSFVGKPKYLDLDYEYKGEIKKISKKIGTDILKIFEELENESGNIPK